MKINGTTILSALSTTTNYVLKQSSTVGTLVNSLIYDDGTNVSIGSTTGEGLLNVAGSLELSNGTDSVKISRGAGAAGRLIISRPGSTGTQAISIGGGNSELSIGSNDTRQLKASGVNFEISNTQVGATVIIGAVSNTGIISFRGNSNIIGLNFFSNTRNLLLQDGGTFTDAGYRLDVAGLTRFQGTTASDTAPLGAELAAVTGTGANWTLAGTNLNVGGYTHTVGATTPLTTTLAAVIGTYYQIAYTITGRTAGSIVIAYGGSSTTVSATGTTGPLATTTGVLIITPTTDFDGNVVISIKTISNSSASSTFANSSGATNIEVRASNINTNTFIGLNVGRKNTTGVNNTAVGTSSQLGTTTGGNNSSFGVNSSQQNTTGTNNSAFGGSSSQQNTTGTNNSAFGSTALQSSTSASNNTAFGSSALQSSTSAGSNSAFGAFALSTITTTGLNVAFGYQAGRYIADKTTTLTLATQSVFLGYRTSPLANNQTNQIVIGYDAIGLGSNTTVLGNSSTVTTAIYGNVGIGTTNVGVKFVNSGGAFSSGPTLGSDVVGSQALLSSNGLYGMYSGVSTNGDVWHQVQANNGTAAAYNLVLQPSGGKLILGTNASIYAVPAKFEILLNGAIEYGINFKTTSAAAIPLSFITSAGVQAGYVIYDATGTSYTTISDYRLKEDLKQINGLDLISKINVYDYKWKSSDKRSYGVMAHELQEIVPQAVFKEKDGKDMQSVDYSTLVPILIQAIKELKAEIELLK